MHKRYADSKRTPREFNIGDHHVYIRVRPKIIYLRLRRYTKLAPRYCVPFEVIASIGPVGYQVILPTTVKVHDVFHASLYIYIYMCVCV